MPKRIIAAITAATSDGEILEQGAEVELTAEDEQRLESQRVLVPPEFASFQAFSDFKQDAYRSGRGDTEAAARMAEGARGGIVDVSGTAPESASYREQIEGGLNADETIALAGDDPDRARAVLQAEHEAQGGESRKGVVEALSKIAGE